jgi:hypothetical protein
MATPLPFDLLPQQPSISILPVLAEKWTDYPHSNLERLHNVIHGLSKRTHDLQFLDPAFQSVLAVPGRSRRKGAGARVGD